MKRKTIATICLLLLILCFGMSDVSAMENNSRAVKGKTVFSLGPHTYISKIVDGYAEAVAGDGTRFELKGEGLDGSYLFIIELLEGDDAYEWLGSVLKSDGKMQRAYVVLLKSEAGEGARLKNGAGEYVPVDKDFTVKIRVEASGEDMKVWHVDPNENKTELEPIKGDGLTVMGTKQDYYAVVSGEPANENPPEENVPGSNTSGSNVPGSNVSKDDFGAIKTGDNTGVFFWVLLLIVGAAGCIAAVKNKRRNMHM